jgi:hypothetical protein
MKTALWMISLAFMAGSALAADKIDAKALLAEIAGRAPGEERQIVGTLKIRPAEGKTRSIPIKWMVLPGGAKWRDIYQTPESASVPAEALIVTHQEGSTNSYEFHRAGQKVADVATNLFQPFATSDFWLVDLGLDFFHWPNPQHVDTEMRKSRSCYVIQSVNPAPRPGAYNRVLSWLDVESGGLLRAEAYDHADKLLKTFTVKDIEKINGRWHIKTLLIGNEQTDSTTRLEFDLKVDE